MDNNQRDSRSDTNMHRGRWIVLGLQAAAALLTVVWRLFDLLH